MARRMRCSRRAQKMPTYLVTPASRPPHTSRFGGRPSHLTHPGRHKAYCDTELATNKQTREIKQSEVEELTASIEKNTAESAQLAEEIKELSEAMAQLRREQAEATAIREKEKAMNAQTVADAKAWDELVRPNALKSRSFELVQTTCSGRANLQGRRRKLPAQRADGVLRHDDLASTAKMPCCNTPGKIFEQLASHALENALACPAGTQRAARSVRLASHSQQRALQATIDFETVPFSIARTAHVCRSTSRRPLPHLQCFIYPGRAPGQRCQVLADAGDELCRRYRLRPLVVP